MKIKKLVIATMAAGISMWLLAGLWHEILMDKFYKGETEATHEGTGIIFLAYIVLGILMAYIYPLGYKGGKPTIEGLRFGLIIGLLWVFPHELVMAGAHGDSIFYVIKNALWHMIEQGLGGIIIGTIYGKGVVISENIK
jgi:hypothetical protein